MSLTRRHALTLLAAGLVGCGTSPRINGSAAIAPSSAPPTQSVRQAEAIVALNTLLAAVNAVEAETTWSAAATGQLRALITRLNTPDPLSDTQQDLFNQPAPGQDNLSDAADAAAQALESAAAEAETPGLRLAYASAATAAVGLRVVSTAPLETTAAPARINSIDVASSLVVALGHAWALVYGLGLALGRLNAQDPTHIAASARLVNARALRNELRDALEGQAPLQPAAFDLPNPMDSTESIRIALAELELNLLAGYARLVAADADQRWRSRMREQVLPVHSMGGALPYWPGWAA